MMSPFNQHNGFLRGLVPGILSSCQPLATAFRLIIEDSDEHSYIQSKTKILDYQRPSMNWVQPIFPNLFSCNLSGLKYQTEFSSSCLVVSCISILNAYAYDVLLTLKALVCFCISSLAVLQSTSSVTYFIFYLLHEGFSGRGIIY